MRTTQLLLTTLKETPADAEVISHQLMLRAGMIRKIASGLYTWMPIGLKVLRKIEAIVRTEMNHSGAQEVLMPVVQPAELWQESGRWEQYGPELLRINDRHNRPFCLGPTHEEVITDLVRNDIQSYKQLPVNLYQIQTKFRDEIRPRFGVMRAREFTMKDAYSFHTGEACLEKTYQIMYDTYQRIFSTLGLDFRAVDADTGSIGGNTSHEFHVLAESGEDAIAFSDGSHYAANVELAEALNPNTKLAPPTSSIEKIATPNTKSIEDVASFLKINKQHIAKTILVKANPEVTDAPLIALILRGDHQLNEVKAEKLNIIAMPLTLATDAEIQSTVGCLPGSLGPAGLTIPVIADRAASVLSDFVSGANEDGFHLTGVNWHRDANFQEIADIRAVVAGDPSPDGKGQLDIKRGIEVGHIFQLGKKYSDALNATVLDENGKSQTVYMGCYGIGVSRVMAAAIEQNHDDKGIIWPDSIAPFSIVIVPMNMHKSDLVRTAAEKLYQDLQAANIDVLMDDRNERPGVKFADMELIGIPHRIVIGEKSLERGVLEYRSRRNSETIDISLASAQTEILSILQNHQ